MLILLLLILLLFGGGGGYYGYTNYGTGGGIGIVGLVVIIVLLLYFFVGSECHDKELNLKPEYRRTQNEAIHTRIVSAAIYGSLQRFRFKQNGVCQ